MLLPFLPAVSSTMHLNILAIDTSTEACSAALLLGDEVRERFEIAPRRHSELILRMIDELFRESGLTLTSLAGLAFGRGPGSFTGVRIAAGVIQGLALGADLGVAPISTLAALAQGAHRQTGSRQVLSVIDARMGEVYWGIYELDASGIMCATQPECVARPAARPPPRNGDLVRSRQWVVGSRRGVAAAAWGTAWRRGPPSVSFRP